jgi:hypothetical protein
MTAGAEDQPPTTAETLAAVALLGVGVVAAAVTRPYDAHTGGQAVLVAAASDVAAFLLFWLGLGLFKIAPGRQVAGAVWGGIPWNVFLLSQLAYLGFFFIPLEVLASAIIVNRRARPPRKWMALALAGTVRLVCFGVVHGVRALT